MSIIREQLLDKLSEIKSSGSFLSTGTRSFVFPGLTVRGGDEIGFPVNPVQIKEIIKVAHKAPFGKGSETVLDTTVRSAWEIDASEIAFNNKDWNNFIEGIIKQIKPDLGVEQHSVSANLYKLLIYEKGDFFLQHKDSEKEKGMFGTLIVGLPSTHTGGNLTVSFDGKAKIVDFSAPSSQYQIPFAAFYADCNHEISPITSGYRVCLVYNLVQNKGEEKIELTELGGYADRLSTILKNSEDDLDIPKIVLLGHQYTPSNFTMEALKLNDRPKAEALILAAEKAGFYAKLGLVTSFQTGELEMDYSKSSRSYRRDRYYDGYGDFDDDELLENGTMGEVFDEYIQIEHWMNEGVPSLGNIRIDEEALISAIQLNEGEPIEKEAEGYTGNAGMEMQYWYHYGAVFLWPRKHQYEILTKLKTSNKLEWINYYNKHWDAIGEDEKLLIKRMAGEGLEENEFRDRSDYSPLADWLINQADEKYLVEKGSIFLTNYFKLIALESWVKLLNKYPNNCFEKVFSDVGEKSKTADVKHLLEVLNLLLEVDTLKQETFVDGQIEKIPNYLNTLTLSDEDEKTKSKDILRNVLKLGKRKQEDGTWLKNVTNAFTTALNRNYVNDVLVFVLLEHKENEELAKAIMVVCKNNLISRVNDKPQPPADWARPLPNTGNFKKVWAFLADFIQSPTQQVFDYRQNQSARTEIENAILNVTIDLTTETIKKGSPHTLRLIKTQAAYQRELAKWVTDVGLLKKVEEW